MAVTAKPSRWTVFYVDLSVKPPVLHSFDDTMGTPADAEARQDRYVIAVFQTVFNDSVTDRLTGSQRYVYLALQERWTGSSLEEIETFIADRIEISANLNGLNLPFDIWQAAVALAETDNRFPGAADPGDYGFPEKNRFNAVTNNRVPLKTGWGPHQNLPTHRGGHLR